MQSFFPEKARAVTPLPYVRNFLQDKAPEKFLEKVAEKVLDITTDIKKKKNKKKARKKMQTSIQINTSVVGKLVESESDEEVIDQAEESFLA